MAGFGSAALAAAKLFGGIQKGKLAGSQRAREEATQRKEAEDAEQRARLDEMVKMSTVGRNKAETAEQLRATSVAPKTFAEFLAREAAGRNPPAPRNIDRLSPEGQTAEVDLARKLEPYRRTPSTADPEAAERRQIERERRAWVASKTREYMKGDPNRAEPAMGTVEAKTRAEAEAVEVYGAPRGGAGRSRQPDPGEGAAAAAAVAEDEADAREAEAIIASGKRTFEQAMASEHLSDGTKAILRQRRAKKPAATAGRDRD